MDVRKLARQRLGLPPTAPGEAPAADQTRHRVQGALAGVPAGPTGIEYFYSQPEAIQLRTAVDNFSFLVTRLRDFLRGLKYVHGGVTKSIAEHWGFDQEDLLTTLVAIFQVLNPALAQPNVLIAYLQREGFVMDIIFYHLLGCKNDTPAAEVQQRLGLFINEMNRHQALMAFPYTQAFDNLQNYLNDHPEATLEEAARQTGIEIKTLNPRFSPGPRAAAPVPPAPPPAAPAPAAPAVPAPERAAAPAAAPEGINFARVRTDRIPDAILQFMDNLYNAFKGPYQGTENAGRAALQIDQLVRGLGIELYKGEKTDVLEVIQELFNIRNEADLARKVREIYDFLKPLFPQFIPSAQHRPRPARVGVAAPVPPPPPAPHVPAPAPVPPPAPVPAAPAEPGLWDRFRARLRGAPAPVAPAPAPAPAPAADPARGPAQAVAKAAAPAPEATPEADTMAQEPKKKLETPVKPPAAPVPKPAPAPAPAKTPPAPEVLDQMPEGRLTPGVPVRFGYTGPFRLILGRESLTISNSDQGYWAFDAHGNAIRSLPEGIHKIGRNADCDICIKTQGVSRRHAQLTIANDVITVTDLHSSNGTWLQAFTAERPIDSTQTLPATARDLLGAGGPLDVEAAPVPAPAAGLSRGEPRGPVVAVAPAPAVPEILDQMPEGRLTSNQPVSFRYTGPFKVKVSASQEATSFTIQKIGQEYWLFYEDKAVASIPPLKKRFRIGRSPDNDIRLSERDVSRHQMELMIENDVITIADLDSANGTFLEAA